MSDRKKMDTYTSVWLEDQGLGEFQESLTRLGVMVFEDLQLLKDEDLERVGMSLVQRRKVQQGISEHLAASSEVQSATSANSGKVGKRHTFNTMEELSAAASAARRSSESSGGSDKKKNTKHTLSELVKGMIRRRKTVEALSSNQSADSAPAWFDTNQSGSSSGRSSGPREAKNGCGYNCGGLSGIQRQNFQGLALDVRINRKPNWDENQASEASHAIHAVLGTSKMNCPQVTWKKLPASIFGATTWNLSRGSVYYSGEMTVTSPEDGSSVKVTAVRGVAQVNASVSQVMGLILMGTNQDLSMRMRCLDGTFAFGQILRIVSPRTDDGSESAFQYPCYPLSSIKRTCHVLPETKVIRDFVFQDHYDIRNHQGRTTGVWAFNSIKLDETSTEIFNGSVIRGHIFEGSGMTVTQVDEGHVEVSIILVGNLNAANCSSAAKSGGIGPFKRKKGECVKQLEAMASIVDSIRVFIDERIAEEGESWCHPTNEIFRPAVFEGISLDEMQYKDAYASGKKKALARLLAENEAPQSVKFQASKFKGLGQVPPLHLRLNSSGNPNIEWDSETDGGDSASTPPPSNQEEAIERMQRELEEMRRKLKEKDEKEKEYKRQQAELEQRVQEALEKKRQSMDLSQFNYEEERRKLMKSFKMAKNVGDGSGGGDDSGDIGTIEGGDEDGDEDEDEGSGGSGKGGRSMEGEIARLRRLLQKYREFLPKDVNEEDLEVTLEDAEAKMRAAVQVLMSSDDPQEQMKAQADFDKWDSIVQNHPDYRERERKKWEKWEEENGPKNKAAFEEMTKIIKREYFKMDEGRLKAAGLKMPLIKRMRQKKVLELLHREADQISRLHAVDLLGTYSTQGLDIVELRALYFHAPETFQNDSDGKKAKWRDGIKEKLSELIKKEENNQLRGEEKRARAYRADSDTPTRTGGFGGGSGPRGAPKLARAPPHGLADALAKKLSAPRGPPGLADALAKKKNDVMGPGGPRPARGLPSGLAAALAKKATSGPRGPPELTKKTLPTNKADSTGENEIRASLERQFSSSVAATTTSTTTSEVNEKEILMKRVMEEETDSSAKLNKGMSDRDRSLKNFLDKQWHKDEKVMPHSTLPKIDSFRTTGEDAKENGHDGPSKENDDFEEQLRMKLKMQSDF